MYVYIHRKIIAAVRLGGLAPARPIIISGRPDGVGLARMRIPTSSWRNVMMYMRIYIHMFSFKIMI